MTFSTFDIIFFIVSSIIVLIAFYRGIVKEFFSLINWILSFAVSYLLSPFLCDLLVNYFESKLVLNISVRIGLFLLTFVIFLFSTIRLAYDLTDSMNIYLNRILGIILGAVKSLVLFGAVYSLYNCFFDYALGQKIVAKNKYRLPSWYINSYSSGVVSKTGEFIDPVVRGFFSMAKKNVNDFIKIDEVVKPKIENDIISKYSDEIESDIVIKKPVDDENNKNKIGKPIPKKPNDVGYDKKDIEKMQQLIEIINN
ncbi:MAG: CvpA family protein [Alphaproteobacteria bacterium]